MTSIRDYFTEHEAKLLASQHGSPPGLAAAVLELEGAELWSKLFEYGLICAHPEKSHLLWIAPKGWEWIADLAKLWTVQELIAYFEARK
jgi:hypothetical protein